MIISGSPLHKVIVALREAGGLPLVVGGAVRDTILNKSIKDYDIEIHKLNAEQIERILSQFGSVDKVGAAFGVFKIAGWDVDFSVPRRDNKIGKGHKGFDTECDPFMGIDEAAKRRDLTINSMAYDPIDNKLFDPFGGRADLEKKVLRATDPKSFLEDPLRALRAAQFAARFEMWADVELTELCKEAALSELPGERILPEFEKLLVKGKTPSIGLKFMRRANLLRFFPELEVMVGCEQEYEWHPEGDVWDHTLLVVDAARGLTDDFIVMMSALCHDMGKPLTTKFEDGRIRSLGHEDAGVEPTKKFLERLRAPIDFTKAVTCLVKYHLSPHHFYTNGASSKAIRRLARHLAEASLTLREIEILARSDHYGRRTPDAWTGEYPAGDWLLEKMKTLDITSVQKASNCVVLGRHVLKRPGFKPGKIIGEILRACQEYEDETGEKDPDRILDTVLSKFNFPDHRSEI